MVLSGQKQSTGRYEGHSRERGSELRLCRWPAHQAVIHGECTLCTCISIQYNHDKPGKSYKRMRWSGKTDATKSKVEN